MKPSPTDKNTKTVVRQLKYFVPQASVSATGHVNVQVSLKLLTLAQLLLMCVVFGATVGTVATANQSEMDDLVNPILTRHMITLQTRIKTEISVVGNIVRQYSKDYVQNTLGCFPNSSSVQLQQTMNTLYALFNTFSSVAYTYIDYKLNSTHWAECSCHTNSCQVYNDTIKNYTLHLVDPTTHQPMLNNPVNSSFWYDPADYITYDHIRTMVPGQIKYNQMIYYVDPIFGEEEMLATISVALGPYEVFSVDMYLTSVSEIVKNELLLTTLSSSLERVIIVESVTDRIVVVSTPTNQYLGDTKAKESYTSKTIPDTLSQSAIEDVKRRNGKTLLNIVTMGYTSTDITSESVEVNVIGIESVGGLQWCAIHVIATSYFIGDFQWAQ
eukprot:PhF_6_TR10397/c0_g1_i1/m.16278